MIKPDIRDFMNSWDEWHAFWIGVFEVLCPWPPHHKIIAWDLSHSIRTEYHYYTGGRVLGILVWLAIIAIIKAILA